MGVKVMNLDEGVKIAKIAKVRDKVSDGNQELEDVDNPGDLGGADSETEASIDGGIDAESEEIMDEIVENDENHEDYDED